MVIEDEAFNFKHHMRYACFFHHKHCGSSEKYGGCVAVSRSISCRSLGPYDFRIRSLTLEPLRSHLQYLCRQSTINHIDNGRGEKGDVTWEGIQVRKNISLLRNLRDHPRQNFLEVRLFGRRIKGPYKMLIFAIREACCRFHVPKLRLTRFLPSWIRVCLRILQPMPQISPRVPREIISKDTAQTDQIPIQDSTSSHSSSSRLITPLSSRLIMPLSSSSSRLSILVVGEGGTIVSPSVKGGRAFAV